MPFGLLGALFVYGMSGLSPAYLFNRMRFPGIFLLFMAMVLPFWSGEVILWQIGPLALRQEGLFALLIIISKFLSIFAVVIVLFATTPFSKVTDALRFFRIPWLLTDLLSFSYRYVYQLTADLQKMRTAARLRGFQSNKASAIKPLANITGTMLVRSQEQSERVIQAMTLRGYGNATQPLPPTSHKPADYYLLAAFLMLSGFYFLFQYVIL